MVQHIVAKTDGVPLYVEELTKMLLQSALLREDADHYTLTGPLGSVAIPDTLQDALMARLDQLHTAKEVAQVGAVLGREFAYEMLQALATQDEATLQAGWRSWSGRNCCTSGAAAAGHLYVQACLDPGRGVCLVAPEHAAAGAPADCAAVRDALSRGGGDAARGGGAALHRRGPGRGRHPLLAAGRPARLQGSAHAEAIAHLTQGLAVLTTLPETPARLQQELDLQVALGPALRATRGMPPPTWNAPTPGRGSCVRSSATPRSSSRCCGG